MTSSQIAREELVTREDILLGTELIDRINACRSRLRHPQSLTPAELEDVYRVLGDCTAEISKMAHDRQQDQAKMATALRLMEQLGNPE